MSLELVRPYFRTRVSALSYTEWTDGFGIDNIPETILDKSFHITHGTVGPRSRSGQDIVYSVPITVNVFFKGYREVTEAIDLGMAGAEAIVNACIKQANYVAPIKLVEFVGFTVEPYEEIENDNIVKTEINFNVIVPVCLY
jgi:hypothetical protein